MDYNGLTGFNLHNLGNKNIILGKNGCGKSHLLKAIETSFRNKEGIGKVRYISPERAGFVVYEAGIDNSINNDHNWIDKNRRRNQSPNFKQQSASLFKRLEHIVLREIEVEHIQPNYVPRTFDATVDKINLLLDRVKIQRSEIGFNIIVRDSNSIANPEVISSGESELISLAIEFLSFFKESTLGSQNILLIDEPDVHLHPDLQDRLATFISNEIVSENIVVIIATHSTALLSSLSRSGDARVAFMKKGDETLNFESISELHKQILPMFGTHPLSNIFNNAPILLVEGEDDQRIWQQAVRSSDGHLNVYPCVATSIDLLHTYETKANEIINSVYDTARGYSLRDRDENPEEIEDEGNIVRMRLSCRMAENLLLSDDVLVFAGINWEIMKTRIEGFVGDNTSHPQHELLVTFVSGGMDRKNADIKEIRNLLMSFIGSKPWEVLVGQTIAEISKGSALNGPDSLKAYLGDKLCAHLLLQP